MILSGYVVQTKVQVRLPVGALLRPYNSKQPVPSFDLRHERMRYTSVCMAWPRVRIPLGMVTQSKAADETLQVGTAVQTTAW